MHLDIFTFGEHHLSLMLSPVKPLLQAYCTINLIDGTSSRISFHSAGSTLHSEHEHSLDLTFALPWPHHGETMGPCPLPEYLKNNHNPDRLTIHQEIGRRSSNNLDSCYRAQSVGSERSK